MVAFILAHHIASIWTRRCWNLILIFRGCASTPSTIWRGIFCCCRWSAAATLPCRWKRWKARWSRRSAFARSPRLVSAQCTAYMQAIVRICCDRAMWLMISCLFVFRRWFTSTRWRSRSWWVACASICPICSTATRCWAIRWTRFSIRTRTRWFRSCAPISSPGWRRSSPACGTMCSPRCPSNCGWCESVFVRTWLFMCESICIEFQWFLCKYLFMIIYLFGIYALRNGAFSEREIEIECVNKTVGNWISSGVSVWGGELIRNILNVCPCRIIFRRGSSTIFAYWCLIIILLMPRHFVCFWNVCLYCIIFELLTVAWSANQCVCSVLLIPYYCAQWNDVLYLRIFSYVERVINADPNDSVNSSCRRLSAINIDRWDVFWFQFVFVVVPVRIEPVLDIQLGATN